MREAVIFGASWRLALPGEVLVLGPALQISEPDFNGAACDFTPPVRWIFLQDFYDFRILDVQFGDLEYAIFNFDFRHGFFSFSSKR